MSIEKRLSNLEIGIEDVKTSKAEFDKNNERFQLLLARMDKQLNDFENRKRNTVLKPAELLQTLSFMNLPKELDQELPEDNNLIKNNI